MDIVISARVPEELVDVLRKRKINLSEIVRASLIEAVNKIKYEEAKKSLSEMSPIMKKIGKENFIKSIREDRDESH